MDPARQTMECSADPMKEELQGKLKGISVGNPDSYQGQLKEILTNSMIFGVDLVEAGLSDKIESMFVAQLAGVGGVRNTLKEYLS